MGVGYGRSYLTGPRPKTLLGPWMSTNLAANLSDSALHNSFTTGGGNILRTFKAIRPGLITGMTTYLNTVNAAPAGTLTISIFKNGADTGADLVLTPSGASDQGTSAVLTTAIAFAKDDTIDLRSTTTADWNSTTGDTVTFLELEV